MAENPEVQNLLGRIRGSADQLTSSDVTVTSESAARLVSHAATDLRQAANAIEDLLTAALRNLDARLIHDLSQVGYDIVKREMYGDGGWEPMTRVTIADEPGSFQLQFEARPMVLTLDVRVERR